MYTSADISLLGTSAFTTSTKIRTIHNYAMYLHNDQRAAVAGEEDG